MTALKVTASVTAGAALAAGVAYLTFRYVLHLLTTGDFEALLGPLTED